jgi:hypothetical protein
LCWAFQPPKSFRKRFDPISLSVTYNLENSLEAYNNPIVYNRLSEYTAMAKEVHEPDYDPRIEDIDGYDVLMRVGGCKRHERSSIPTLS